MKIDPGKNAVYPLTPSQNTILFQQKYALNKNVQNIPFFFTTEKVINFDIMKAAIKEELRRNDAMRLRIFKKGKEIFQFFAPSIEMEEVPVYLFANQAEQDSVLGKIASKPLNPYKNQFYKIVLFKTENKYGVFIVAHHVCLDGMSVNIFFKDLCDVYDALQSAAPMPKPMSSFEEYVKRDLELLKDSEKRKKDAEFLAELMESEGEPIYAGADGMRLLNKQRAKKKNPNRRSITMFDPIHEKTEKLGRTISPMLMNEIRTVAKSYSISPIDFISSAMRIYLSAINGDCNDVTIMDTVSRRASAAARNMGGCLVHSADVRTVFTEDEPFFEMCQALSRRYMQLYRHIDFDTLSMLDISHEVWKHPQGDDYVSMIFSYMPLLAVPGDTWNRDYGGYNSGAFSHVMYTNFLEDPKTGGMKCFYSYRKNLFTVEEIGNLFEQMVNILEKAVEDPTRTVSELKKAITVRINK